MMYLQRFGKLCKNTLLVVLFYTIMLWWGFQLEPLFGELYEVTPFIVFLSVSFFMMLFLCRETGCFVFLDKGRLKAILRNGETEPTASQIVLRLFSFPFLKRVALFFSLFVFEFYFRLLLIKLFLITVQATLGFWEKIASVSDVLVYGLMALAAYAIMELPAWALFYKVSFKGRSNRSYEYRFGIKLSVLTALILTMRFVQMALTAETSALQEALSWILLAGASFGLWYLMYRKKCCCAGGCPICNVVKGLFKRKKKSEETPVIESVSEEKE